jgi:transcriptional regulator with XRE-family HTH domain
MSSTLKERMRKAMEGPPRVTGAALARACGIKPPSVSAWLSGHTKSIDGSHLLAAARLLRVRPEWLADGLGHMREPEPGTPSSQEPTPPPYHQPSAARAKAQTLLGQLQEDQLPEATALLEWLVEKHKKKTGNGGGSHPVSGPQARAA